MATVGLNVIATDDAQLVLSAVGVQGASSVAGFFDVSGVTYALSQNDKNKVGRFTNASGITVTVPSGLSTDFNCALLQLGAGQVTVRPSIVCQGMCHMFWRENRYASHVLAEK